jgi:NAD-dependent dihydropyrimidine dehydrogenase PreA subunit
MVHVIDEDKCISCGSCAGTCPQEAIVEGDRAYTINDDCVDCGSCIDACPVEAISA